MISMELLDSRSRTVVYIRTISILLQIVVLLLSSELSAQPFSYRPPLAKGVDLIDTADFDADGLLDIIAFCSENGEGVIDRTFGWFKNLGNGQFADFESKLELNTLFTRCRTLDIDSDGDLDVISYLGALVIYKNTNGNFAEGDTLFKDAKISDMATFDLDKDGILEFAIFAKPDRDKATELVVFRSARNGERTEQRYEICNSFGIRDLYNCKFNRITGVNQHPDLERFLRANKKAKSCIEVAWHQLRYLPPSLPVKYADFDGNGVKDSLVIRRDKDSGMAEMSVVLYDHAGGPIDSSRVLNHYYFRHHALIDADGDSDTDILLFHYDEVLWSENGGDHGFSYISWPILYGSATKNEDYDGVIIEKRILADFDQDGDQDILMISDASYVEYIENIGPPDFQGPFRLGNNFNRPLTYANEDDYPSPDLNPKNKLNSFFGLSLFGVGSTGSYRSQQFLQVAASDHLVVLERNDSLLRVLNLEEKEWQVIFTERCKGCSFSSAEFHDLDGDGKDELVISTAKEDDRYAIHRSYFWFTKTNGKYKQKEKLATNIVSGLLTDLDQDGIAEFVGIRVPDSTDSPCSLIISSLKDEFSSPSETAIDGIFQQFSNWIELSACDIDVDGDMDLLFTEKNRKCLNKVVLNNGDGKFGPLKALDRSSGKWDNMNVRVEDVDGDGDPDLINGGTGLLVFKNMGNGDFGEGRFVFGPEIRDYELVDLDNDGDKDLVAIAVNGPGVFWSENVQGEFGPATPLLVMPASLTSLNCSDIDNDGWQDLLITVLGSSDPYWMRNSFGDK